ncbi:hypothetical protein [Sphingobium aromaticiconvertens]|uniref:hypothetical protein n=1 Tax=Sphingobium aromaticiconvertens TaxID=365341 RepID=UPI0030167F9D
MPPPSGPAPITSPSISPCTSPAIAANRASSQVNSKEPSVFTDLYPNGGPGFHHVALIVDNLQATMKEFEEKGLEEGFYGEVTPGGVLR